MLLAQSHQIREADRRMIEALHVPGILLMEQAGRLAAEYLLETFPTQSNWLILAGPGNNGGDGLVIARYLHLAGQMVQVVLTRSGETYTGDAAINYRILAELPVPLITYGEEPLETVLQDFPERPWLIDALLGTGVQAELHGPVAELIRELRREPWISIAIDLPSGLSADTGEVVNFPIPALHTLSFQAPKICHAVHPAAPFCGETKVLDIGIWPSVMQDLQINRQWVGPDWLHQQRKPRVSAGHKGSYGHVLLVAGCEAYGGAATLAAMGAVHSGAGLCTVITPHLNRTALLSQVPECMVIGLDGPHLGPADISAFEQALNGKQAVVIGPGLGQHPDTVAFLATVLPWIQVPLLLDADALNLLAQHAEWWNMLPDETILTPHPGEMRRLTGLETLQHRRLEVAERMAQDRQVHVLLKGAGSIAALRDGRSFVSQCGNPGLGTGGTGDVLSGIIGSLMAQGYPTGEAAAIGMVLHAWNGDRLAAQVGMEGLTAGQLARSLHWPA